LPAAKKSRCLPRTGANANRPLTIQGKAKALKSTDKKSAAQATSSSKAHRRRQTDNKAPRRQKTTKP
jgi:hypothetical protein